MQKKSDEVDVPVRYVTHDNVLALLTGRESIPTSMRDSWERFHNNANLEGAVRASKRRVYFHLLVFVFVLVALAAIVPPLWVFTEQPLEKFLYFQLIGIFSASIAAALVWWLTYGSSGVKHRLVRQFIDGLNNFVRFTGLMPSAFEANTTDEVVKRISPRMVKAAVDVLVTYSDEGYPTAATIEPLRQFDALFDFTLEFGLFEKEDRDRCFIAAGPDAEVERKRRQAEAAAEAERKAAFEKAQAEAARAVSARTMSGAADDPANDGPLVDPVEAVIGGSGNTVVRPASFDEVRARLGGS